MSDVIYGHFGTNAPSPQHEAAQASVRGTTTAELLFGYDEDRAKKDLAYIDENRPMIETVSDRTEDMRRNAFLRQPTDAFLDRIERQREGFLALPMHEICQQIMLSKREHWSIMAVLHAALVLEFVARLHQAGIYRQHQLAQRS